MKFPEYLPMHTDKNINQNFWQIIIIYCVRVMHYRTLYVLKGWEDPSEHVNTNWVEKPQGTLICSQQLWKLKYIISYIRNNKFTPQFQILFSLNPPYKTACLKNSVCSLQMTMSSMTLQNMPLNSAYMQTNNLGSISHTNWTSKFRHHQVKNILISHLRISLQLQQHLCYWSWSDSLTFSDIKLLAPNSQQNPSVFTTRWYRKSLSSDNKEISWLQNTRYILLYNRPLN